MVAQGHRQRGMLAVSVILLATTGCLGQDYRDVDLALSDWVHGWLAVVEPEEAFTVGLPENPQYPGASWIVAAAGEPTLELVASAVEQPPDEPGEQVTLAFWVFDMVARDLGEAALDFQLEADGRAVDRMQLQVAVV